MCSGQGDLGESLLGKDALPKPESEASQGEDLWSFHSFSDWNANVSAGGVVAPLEQ